MIKSDPKTRFFYFLKNFAIDFCWKCPLINIYVVIYLTVQIPYLGKLLLFSYNLKGFQPISLQDSLITNTSCLNGWISLIFRMYTDSQNRKNLQLNFLLGMVRHTQGCTK